MRNTLADVVAAALRVLDEQGLEGCSMRRVAAALDVQPSALYHHVPNKQSLLALMADEIVRSVGEAAAVRSALEASGAALQEMDAAHGGDGAVAARSLCIALRDAMLAVRDGADVVATAAAFRLGASDIERRLTALVGPDGARTLLLFTFGHAQSTQTHRQAAAFGALLTSGGDDGDAGSASVDLDESFARGLDIISRGLALQV